MKKVLVILEGLSRSRKNKFLRKLEKYVKMIELICWIIPTVKIKNRNSQLVVLSHDYEITNVLKRVGISNIESYNEKFNKNETESIFRESTELFDKLYRFHDVSDKIVFLDVNLILILQEDFTNLFFDRIKKLKHIQNLIEDINPTSIYAENIYSPMGQIVISVAESNQIQVFSILPNFYAIAKNKITKYLFYSRYRIPSVHNNTLHLLSQSNNGEYKILSYVPYINFLDAVFPVIKILSENNLPKTNYVLGRKEDILKYSDDFVEIPIAIENVGVSEEIKKIKYYFMQIFEDEVFQGNFEVSCINFWKSVKDDLHYMVHYNLINLMWNLKECDVILEMINPDIILVGDDRTTHVRTCVLLAKNKKIPVIEIQHGIYTHINPRVSTVSDKICVFGNYTKDVLINTVEKKDQIIVTGCPKFDSLFDKKNKHKMPVDKKKCKKILIATQYGIEDITMNAIEKCVYFSEIEENVCIVIKPHPAENPDVYNRFTRIHENVIVENHRRNIDDLLLDADVLVTMNSTVGLNAAILDVPMILLNFKKTASPYSSISLEVRDIEKIIPAIRDLLYNKKMLQGLAEARKQFVYEHAYIQDGKASDRVLRILITTLQESKSGVHGQITDK